MCWWQTISLPNQGCVPDLRDHKEGERSLCAFEHSSECDHILRHRNTLLMSQGVIYSLCFQLRLCGLSLASLSRSLLASLLLSLAFTRLFSFIHIPLPSFFFLHHSSHISPSASNIAKQSSCQRRIYVNNNSRQQKTGRTQTHSYSQKSFG